MASTATQRLRLEQQGTGENPNVWGTRLNSVLSLLDESQGVKAIPLSANYTLTNDNFVSNDARRAVLRFTGTGLAGNAPALVTIPSTDKWYIVHNACSGDITIGVAGQPAATIRAGQIAPIYCDGTTTYVDDPTLDTIKAAAADLNLNAKKITNLAAGTLSSDAARIDQTGPFAVADAQVQAALAKDWATKTSGEVVAGQGYGAKYYAQAAAVFDPANYYTKAQADASIAGQVKPVLGRATKSANYTLTTGDRGYALDLTGSFTLSLPAAASLPAGFFFWVRKNDGAGTWVIDPNGSETIDGLATISVYQETFLVWTDAVAWYTQDRPRGWIPLARTTLGATVASVSISQGFSDPEMRHIAMDFQGFSLTATATVYLRNTKSGSSVSTTTHRSASVQASSGSVTGSTGTTDAQFTLMPSGLGPIRGMIVVRGIQSATSDGQHIEYTFSDITSPKMFTGMGVETTNAAIQGVLFFASGGSFTAGTYSVQGYRA